MDKKKTILAAMAVLLMAISLTGTEPLRAEDGSSSYAEDSGEVYDVWTSDPAELLTASEQEELYYAMEPGTIYGNMVFLTTDDTEGYSSSDYVEMIYQTTEGLKGTDAVIFLIDMDHRLLWITGYGNLKKSISPDYANLITDNIYRYAAEGEFGKCAVEGFRQINARLSGERLSGPLRTMGNLSIALILAAVICFLLAYASSTSRKAGEVDILNNMEKQIRLTNPQIQHTKTTRIYDPPKSSGGSGSSGGFHGGGGGGGFHGGGGGHGF